MTKEEIIQDIEQKIIDNFFRLVTEPVLRDVLKNMVDNMALYTLPAGLTTNKGNWDAYNNDPELVSGTGTAGDYYIVSVAGTTEIDGFDDWEINDYIWFDGSTETWQQIKNSASTAPGGISGNIQFNLGGIFAGVNELWWDNENKRLGVGSYSWMGTRPIPLETLDIFSGSVRIRSLISKALLGTDEYGNIVAKLLNKLQDADGDTYIDVEATTDNDKIIEHIKQTGNNIAKEIQNGNDAVIKNIDGNGFETFTNPTAMGYSEIDLMKWIMKDSAGANKYFKISVTRSSGDRIYLSSDIGIIELSASQLKLSGTLNISNIDTTTFIITNSGDQIFKVNSTAIEVFRYPFRILSNLNQGIKWVSVYEISKSITIGNTSYTSTVTVPAGSIIESIYFKCTQIDSGGGATTIDIGLNSGSTDEIYNDLALAVTISKKLLNLEVPSTTAIKFTVNSAPTGSSVLFEFSLIYKNIV